MAASSSLLTFKACLSWHNTEALTLRHYGLTRQLKAKVCVVGREVFHLIVSIFVHDLRLHLGFTIHYVVDSTCWIVSQLWHLVHVVREVRTSSFDATEAAAVRCLSISTALVLFSLLFLLGYQRE